MRLLVFGQSGQVARALQERANGRRFPLVFAGRTDCDLEVPGAAAEAIAGIAPDLIINTAAYTAVDRAEAEPQRASRLNADAVAEIARSARSLGCSVIHLSTDYVFDGRAKSFNSEDEPSRPLNVYGRTKRRGEEHCLAEQPDSIILRTSWLYSPFGQNFVRTMLRLAGERDEISVVDDQVGCPTNALDLADLILNLAERRLAGDVAGWGGVYHVAGRDAATWAELAAAVMRISAACGGPSAAIRRVATSEFRTAAQRPANSRLDSGKLRGTFGLELPGFHDRLGHVVKRLVEGDDQARR